MPKEKRISISQLSEYLTSGPGRRKSIIADAADTKPFIANTYKAASDAISASITDGAGGDLKMASSVAKLMKKATDAIPDWQKQHVKLCLESLTKFQAFKPDLNLSEWTVLQPNIGPGSIMIGGVRVTISPEAILMKDVGNETRIGALKFHYAKTKKLDQKRADYIGAALDWYCEEHLSNSGMAHHKCSLVVDLPSSAMHFAPKAKVRNRNDLEAACEEIATMWPD